MGCHLFCSPSGEALDGVNAGPRSRRLESRRYCTTLKYGM
jgi:hypothetical protein